MSEVRLYRGEKECDLTALQLEHRRFMASDKWEDLRQECYRLADWKCVRCGAAGICLNAHHKTYPERIEDTQQTDLECLCYKCHYREHRPKRRTQRKKSEWWALMQRAKQRVGRQLYNNYFKPWIDENRNASSDQIEAKCVELHGMFKGKTRFERREAVRKHRKRRWR